MMDVLHTLLGMATMAGVIFAVGAMVRHRYLMRRLRKEAKAASITANMTVPEFAALERHYGKALPEDVRWLYEQRELITKHAVELRSRMRPEETYLIDHFLPATVKAVTSTWFDVGPDHFPFAIDEAGNYYVVKLGDRGSSEVLYVDHEQSAVWPIASSLRDFVIGGEPRTSNR